MLKTVYFWHISEKFVKNEEKPNFSGRLKFESPILLRYLRQKGQPFRHTGLQTQKTLSKIKFYRMLVLRGITNGTSSVYVPWILWLKTICHLKKSCNSKKKSHQKSGHKIYLHKTMHLLMAGKRRIKCNKETQEKKNKNYKKNKLFFKSKFSAFSQECTHSEVELFFSFLFFLGFVCI